MSIKYGSLAMGLAIVSFAASASGQDAQLPEVIIATPGTTCLSNFPIFTALEEGYFEEEGFRVRTEALNGSASVVQALAAGQAQFGTPGAIPVLHAWDRGERLLYVANLKPGGSFALITPIDGASSLEDLRGGVIGAATADGNEVSFLTSAFAAFDMHQPDDYTVQIVGDGGPAVAAFLRGDIDAFAASIADAAIISNAGLEMQNITPEEAQYIFGNGLATTVAFASEHPEIVEGFGRSYRRGIDLGRENPERVLDNCVKYNPQELEDRDYAAAVLQVVIDSTVALGDDQFGYMRPDHWERLEADTLATGDYDGSSFELTDAYTNDFVAAFNQ